MAKTILRNPQIVVNGVDLSNRCSAIAIENSAEDVDLSGYTSKWKETAQAYKNVTITASFFQDYATASVHQTLQPLYDSYSTFDISVMPDAAQGVSSTNPRFELTSRLLGYTPLQGGPGDAVVLDAVFRNASYTGFRIVTGGLFPDDGLFPDNALEPE